MAKKVLKFGGTSVGTIERILHVAKIIQKEHTSGNKIIVVVSAMSGKTNELLEQSQKVSDKFNKRELDVLMSSGEQVTRALLSGALIDLGINSKSWLNWQIPILTEGEHSNARIINMNVNEINKFLSDEKGVAVIPGFQGISKKREITTIGRGGSDATAVAIAKIFEADSCEIYTDVDGVFSTDPNKIPVAKKIEKISYEEMLEMASLGAKVMQPASIQDARLNRINIEVKSSFKSKPGTLITKKKNISANRIITGVSFTKNDSKITLIGVVDKPGVAASIFEPLSRNVINVDMVVQNISADGRQTDLTFTIKNEDIKKTEKLLRNNKKIKFQNILIKRNVSKISIIGVGMITTPGVTYRMFKALSKQKINIQVISTSEIKISVLIDKRHIKKAVKALHKEFELEK